MFHHDRPFRGRRGPGFFDPRESAHGPHWASPKGGPPHSTPPWDGPPFGDDAFGRGGGRRRHRRGDIKYALLELLAERPRHGYELIKELEQRYGGFYRPSPGTVYPTLQLLEEEGHLTMAAQDGKRVYTVTESGLRLLEERRAEGPREAPWSRGSAPGGAELHELRAQLQGLMAAVQQVAQHGTPEQRQAAMARLEATRRELYRILAGDEGE